MLTTTPKRNPASKRDGSDARPRPSEGDAQARREPQRRHPAACSTSPKRRTVKQRIKVFLAGGVLAFAAALATKVGRS